MERMLEDNGDPAICCVYINTDLTMAEKGPGGTLDEVRKRGVPDFPEQEFTMLLRDAGLHSGCAARKEMVRDMETMLRTNAQHKGALHGCTSGDLLPRRGQERLH